MDKGLRVYVIDDNEVNLFVNKRYLEKVSFPAQVEVFGKTIDALDAIQKSIAAAFEFFPDIILLDIHVPPHKCWGFLDEYQKMTERSQIKTLIFIISSSIDLEETSRAKEHPLVEDFIEAPLDMDKINMILDKWQKIK